MSDKKFVIDASVAAKWFLWEDGTDEALKLLDDLTFFYAPDIFLLEIDAVITKRVKQNELEIDEAIFKKKQFRDLTYHLISYKQVGNFAFELSTSFPITLYDACYLATAIAYDAILYTADIRFFNGVSSTPFKKHIEKIDY